MTYNKREIMTIANVYRREHGLNMSDALRAAWLKAKVNNIHNAMDALNYDPITKEAPGVSVHEIYFVGEEYKKLGYRLMSLNNAHYDLVNKHRFAA